MAKCTKCGAEIKSGGYDTEKINASQCYLLKDGAWNSSRVDKVTFPSRNATLVTGILLFYIIICLWDHVVLHAHCYRYTKEV